MQISPRVILSIGALIAAVARYRLEKSQWPWHEDWYYIPIMWFVHYIAIILGAFFAWLFVCKLLKYEVDVKSAEFSRVLAAMSIFMGFMLAGLCILRAIGPFSLDDDFS